VRLCSCSGVDKVCAIDPDKPTPDQVTQHFAHHLHNIYKERTAGDYTFTGVLYQYSMMMAKV
jgi:hypothetical protein